MSKAFFFAAAVGLAVSAFAAPPMTPVLDGRMNEYDAVDQRASYTGGGSGWPGSYLKDLYVTWDSNYLYIALSGSELDNKLVVMLDVDPGNGTGATTTTNWLSGPSYIVYNDVGWRAAPTPDFGLDYMVASEGFYNNALRILYDGDAAPDTNTVNVLFDAGNGGTPVGTPVDMAVYEDSTSCSINGFETRIPWSKLYGENTNRFGVVNPGELVPRGAVIRMFANIHNNTPSAPYSAGDAIPQQSGGAYLNGLLTSDTYLDVTIDGDDDGFPDLAVTDVNAPWIRYASGVASNRQVFVQFSEPVQESAATDTNNWMVDSAQPGSVTMLSTNTLILNLTNDLPVAGSLALVTATNVADNSGNQRLASYCLLPAASGLTNTLTVRFVLESNSGLGANPGASNFYVNGGSFPLEFGYPPATSSPLAVLSGSLRYRDVIFPPGTPGTLNYKYSGKINNTGTNNYEAVRLADYADKARVLTLNPSASFMTVTDYLGAAGAPWRDPSSNFYYQALYTDANRGDAGVRTKVNLLFTLNLSQRNPAAIQRVMVQGTDPLRGFNSDGSVSDYAGGGAVGWTQGGIQLFDDGSNGDAVAGDHIYSRLWAATPDGTDETVVPDYPNYLVGGDYGIAPYYADAWVNGRSPRSFKYKFYVLKTDNSVVEAPYTDQEVYLEDSLGTNLTFEFLWDNDGLPMAAPTNSPSMDKPVILTGGQVRVLFENLTNELQHGILISTNLSSGWMDFGQRASGSAGLWTALVSNANAAGEYYAASAGAAKPAEGVWFNPNPLPDTGGVLRVWYRQHSRTLAGSRVVGLTGPWNGWGNGQPMTFYSDGSWYYDLTVGVADSSIVVFKARSTDGTWESGSDVYAYKGYGRMTWSPASPTNGELLAITYNANGGPLAAATNVNAYVGFDEGWSDVGNRRMTNAVGETNVWVISFVVPTNRTLSVNAVFNNGGATWDSEGNPGTGGRQNRVFITPRPYGVTP